MSDVARINDKDERITSNINTLFNKFKGTKESTEVEAKESMEAVVGGGDDIPVPPIQTQALSPPQAMTDIDTTCKSSNKSSAIYLANVNLVEIILMTPT